MVNTIRNIVNDLMSVFNDDIAFVSYDISEKRAIVEFRVGLDVVYSYPSHGGTYIYVTVETAPLNGKTEEQVKTEVENTINKLPEILGKEILFRKGETQ